ncbi:MAG: KTSC domain-containing protein [Ardenticatenaceae bacterium]
MKMHYYPDEDLLTVFLKPDTIGSCDFETGDVIATVDEEDELVSLVISHAAYFIERALAAGISIKEAPAVTVRKGMVWYDADSSMIGAFGYDEEHEVLDLAFHTTGVYRYFGVPHDIFKGLCEAPSKGRYLRDTIIRMYPSVKRQGR